jgi:hypothetical protein
MQLVDRPMTYKSILFVDYENVGKVDLNAIPADVLVPFFFGASQKSVPTEFMKAALKLGQRFIPIDIEGQGTNALDFHIAFYLGEYLTSHAAAECIILSKDKGFDLLVKHLRGRKFNVRRVTTLIEAFSLSLATGSPTSKVTSGVSRMAELSHIESAMKWLGEMQPRARPRKRKGLIAHLSSRFGKKLTEPELHTIVDRLIADKKVTEVGGALGYEL